MPAERRPSEVILSEPVRRLVAIVSAAALLAVACGTATPSGSAGTPSAPATVTASPTAATTPSSSTPSEPPSTAPPSPPQLPTQSTVAWGRIWDALPAGFPRPAGAVPSEIDVAVSGVFDLAGDVSTASGLMQGALEAAGFRTEGVSGPLEDGSVVIDSSGPVAGCRVQTTIVRQGGATMMTVLYGASCQFE
jgi:hypothetical protein